MLEPVTCTLWSDPLCIWAFVGQHRVDDVLRDLGSCVRISHRVVPVFGSVPQRFRDGSWAKDGPAGRAAATARIAAEHGHTHITGQVWIDDPPASSWPPGAAIKAVGLAEAHGQLPAGAGAHYQAALRTHLFVENRNTARRSEQLLVAEELGYPRGLLEAALDDGRALAALWEDQHDRERDFVSGSPTWVFDGGRARLYGNFPQAVLDGTIRALIGGDFDGCSSC
jgi:predicted DsbA family dithiol-disulfide isomerase